MLIITTTATAMTLFAIALLLPAATSVPQPGHRSLQLQRDQAFEDTVIIPTGIEWGKHVQPSITAHASYVDGHTTYSLELTPVGNAETIYALYGHPQVALEMPPAYHVAAPFGTNFGGTPTPLLTLRAEAQFDSFLFAAESFGKLGSVGIDFDSWTSDHGLSSNNGAVFYADPNDAVAFLQDYEYSGQFQQHSRWRQCHLRCRQLSHRHWWSTMRHTRSRRAPRG